MIIHGYNNINMVRTFFVDVFAYALQPEDLSYPAFSF